MGPPGGKKASRLEAAPSSCGRVGLVLLGALAAAPVRGAEPSSRPPDLRAHVRFLSAPELEGRGALTAGLNRAAEYLAERFRAVGLVPAGDRGTFFQAVEIPLPRRPAAGTRLEIGGEALRLGIDFVPNLGSPARRAVAPLAFAGYGTAADLDAIDVRGKAVVCLEGGPAVPAKMELAVARGALALLVVDADESSEEGLLRPLPMVGGGRASAIASFHLRPSAIQPSLASSGTSLGALRAALDRRPRPVSFDLPTWLTFALDWSQPSIPGRNVVGLLEGSDPALAGEAVLVGAHYDHLGQGNEGNVFDAGAARLHPGADDNASGIAALLDVAERLVARHPRPRRSVLFVAFTGEEKGLVGSSAVAAHPPRQIVAMLNLDMVGRMRDDTVEVGGVSTSPEWPSIVEAANVDRLALRFPARLVPNSDHAPFVRRGVPALFFFTGMHGDYHRATDTWDKVNFDGLGKIAGLAGRVVRAAADRPTPLSFIAPTWTSGAAPTGGGP